jgi:hypothetical protein
MGLGIENFSFPINSCIRKKPKSVVISVYHYTYFFVAKFVDLGCKRKSCDVPHQISFLPLFPVVILSFSLSLSPCFSVILVCQISESDRIFKSHVMVSLYNL